MSPICPTAAAAWSSWSACGRRFQPRRCMPSAIAPLETSTISRPSCLSAAICCAQRASASRSSPCPSLVTRLLPTLTTRRFALASTEAMSLDGGSFARDLVEVIHDRVGERRAAFFRERRNHERRTFPPELAHESLHRLVSRLGGQQIHFVDD